MFGFLFAMSSSPAGKVNGSAKGSGPAAKGGPKGPPALSGDEITGLKSAVVRRGGGRGGPRPRAGRPRGGKSDGKEGITLRGDGDAAYRSLFITQTTDIKEVAADIANALRQNAQIPTLVATGERAINQSVKAICIARNYVSANLIDFKIYPEFQPNRMDKNGVERNDSVFFYINPSSTVVNLQEADLTGVEVLRSSGRGKASKMAGKISNTVREGKRVVAQAVGPSAVWRFVQSLLLAKAFVQQDNSLDLSFRPTFVHLESTDGEELNAVQFHVYAEQI